MITKSVFIESVQSNLFLICHNGGESGGKDLKLKLLNK